MCGCIRLLFCLNAIGNPCEQTLVAMETRRAVCIFGGHLPLTASFNYNRFNCSGTAADEQAKANGSFRFLCLGYVQFHAVLSDKNDHPSKIWLTANCLTATGHWVYSSLINKCPVAVYQLAVSQVFD
eukprot:6177874-Pleurochrysis_carterae.AAC.3